MEIFKWLRRVLTKVSIEVDADGNAHVYPYLIGYFKNKEWRRRKVQRFQLR